MRYAVWLWLPCILVAVGCDVFLTVDNRRPVAQAGPDLEARLFETVKLDGTESYDPDGDQLTFKWELQSTPSGAVAGLSDATSETPEIVPDKVGAWRISLKVSDGDLFSREDDVLIAVRGDCMQPGDCGDGSWSCDDGVCSCEVEACSDSFCRLESGCCQNTDCGTGGWNCDAGHACVCASEPCADGHCPVGDECCVDRDCAPGSVCTDHGCVGGGIGALVIDWNTCTLDGTPCPVEYVTGSGTTWMLVDNDAVFTNVSLSNGAELTAPAVDATGTGGRLVLRALGVVTVGPSSRITMSDRGWGGGGGGAGLQYCDSNADCEVGTGGGAGGAADPNGEPGTDGDARQCYTGYTPSTVGGGNGGEGGGDGGAPGSNGRCGYAHLEASESDGLNLSRCPDPPVPLGDGTGGSGGGSFGGTGGDGYGNGNTCEADVHCDEAPGPDGADPWGVPERAEAGQRGGYATPGGNGDASTDDTVAIGSGGGGGAGGDMANGDCCGAADGGHGGAPGGSGRSGCTGGGGGGGGGAGGGAIEIRARDVVVRGEVIADGAGHATALGGYGAGGGILLYAEQDLTIGDDAVIRSLGGFGDGLGSPINGGTIKLFYREIDGEAPTVQSAGRVFEQVLDP